LPASSYANINLTWSGTDEAGGSGLAFFDIFASVDGGPFQVWLPRTTLTGSVYPGQLGHEYAFYSLATDNAGNRQSSPLQPDAQTFVSLTNSPPVIIGSTNITIDENQTLSLTLPASDPDPGQTLTYTVLSAPAGLSIGASSGLITWPTTEATGPSTNAFSVVVTDNGSPSLSATSLVTVIVREVNQPPVIGVISNYNISEGQLLSFVVPATDPDIPANILTFSLGPNPPAGVALNPTNGLFTWRPDSTQGPSTNLISVIVTDNGTPPLSATQSFSVIVRDTLSDFNLDFGWTNVLAGEANTLPLVLRASLPLANITLQVSVAPAGQLANLALRPLAAEVTAASLSPAGPNNFTLTLNFDPSLQTASVRPVATLDFLSISNAHSVIVFLTPSQLLAGQTGGPAVTNGSASRARVIIVAREPVLDITPAPLQLTLYGQPGSNYAILSSSNLLDNIWTTLTTLTVTNRVVTIPAPSPTANTRYYRLQLQ
jgi:hypothetical protein